MDIVVVVALLAMLLLPRYSKGICMRGDRHMHWDGVHTRAIFILLFAKRGRRNQLQLQLQVPFLSLPLSISLLLTTHALTRQTGQFECVYQRPSSYNPPVRTILHMYRTQVRRIPYQTQLSLPPLAAPAANPTRTQGSNGVPGWVPHARNRARESHGCSAEKRQTQRKKGHRRKREKKKKKRKVNLSQKVFPKVSGDGV